MKNVQQGWKYMYLKFREFLINAHDAIVIIRNSINFRSFIFFIFNIKNTLTLNKDSS